MQTFFHQASCISNLSILTILTCYAALKDKSYHKEKFSDVLQTVRSFFVHKIVLLLKIFTYLLKATDSKIM